MPEASSETSIEHRGRRGNRCCAINQTEVYACGRNLSDRRGYSRGRKRHLAVGFVLSLNVHRHQSDEGGIKDFLALGAGATHTRPFRAFEDKEHVLLDGAAGCVSELVAGVSAFRVRQRPWYAGLQKCRIRCVVAVSVGDTAN